MELTNAALCMRGSAIPDKEDKNTVGQSWRPARRWLWWILACIAAGAITRGAHPYTLILTGLVFGVGQSLVLRHKLRQTSWLAAALWLPASALAGLAGYLIVASWGVRTLGPPIIAFASPHHNLASHIVFVTMLWSAIGLAQWPILRQQLDHAGWWVPASAAGGMLGALTDVAIELAGGAMHGSPLAGALAGASYGALTGSVLRRLEA